MASRNAVNLEAMGPNWSLSEMLDCCYKKHALVWCSRSTIWCFAVFIWSPHFFSFWRCLNCDKVSRLSGALYWEKGNTRDVGSHNTIKLWDGDQVVIRNSSKYNNNNNNKLFFNFLFCKELHVSRSFLCLCIDKK